MSICCARNCAIIWNICIKWDYFAKDTMGKQLVRAADSISANLAEGHGRFHFKDRLNFCYYARGSLEETKTWLSKAFRRGLISSELVEIKQIVEIFFDADLFPTLSDTDQKNFELLLREASSRTASLTPLSTRAFSKIAFGNRNEGLVAVARFQTDSVADFKPRPDAPIFILEGIEKLSREIGTLPQSSKPTHAGVKMAKSDHERVGEALRLLKQGLWPFVEREFRARGKIQISMGDHK